VTHFNKRFQHSSGGTEENQKKYVSHDSRTGIALLKLPHEGAPRLMHSDLVVSPLSL